MSFPLMAIHSPLYLVQKAITLQEDMIRRNESSLVDQERWDTTLKFDWMCQAILLNPSLEVLQFLHSKGCCLLNQFKEFLSDKEPTEASLIAMQELATENIEDPDELEFIASSFVSAYSDDTIKFIFQNLI
jgi:hypothetical protein